MLPSVRTEQGMTTMPSVMKEPEEIEAPMSPWLWTTVASARTCSTVWLVSCSMVRCAHLLMTRWDSTSECFNASSSLMPKTAPVEPVMPIMRRRIAFLAF
jgi:hypothetical protein